MEGFTVSNANKFLQTGGDLREIKTTVLNNPESSAFPSADKPGQSFSDTLKAAVGQVNELQKEADVQMQNLATGKTDNIQEVMMAAEKADLALKLMVQVRNKVIEAYQEVMKMQV